MSKKNKNEKNHSKIRRHSINTKTFFITLLLTFGIGAVVLVVGFIIYVAGVIHEYYVNTWNLANAEAVILEEEGYREKCDEILAIYDSYPEEERLADSNDAAEDAADNEEGASSQNEKAYSPEYIASFTPTIDKHFVYIQKRMRDLQERNGPLNAFIVAIDQENDRMIYLIDADKRPESFVEPGTWDIYPSDDLDKLVNGRDAVRYEKKFGIQKGVQAIIANIAPYGYRCTAGSTLYETDKYTVMVCVDEKMEQMIIASKIFLAQYVSVLLLIVLIAALIGTYLIRRDLVLPINRLERAASAYYEDDNRLEHTNRYFSDLDIHTGDEIEKLAMTMKEMEEEMVVYVRDLTRATSEKERINTELTLAAKIQESMLPRVFPAFPQRTEFDVFASMSPAKEVGGDFYDFFMVDEDHLMVEIADVSGKGIPASLYMTATKILLAASVRAGLSPANVLAQTNTRVCANNPEEMFVTVWLGILEISTGKMIAANAGHEYPIRISADGQAELIRDKHGFVIGGLDGMQYKDYEIQLAPGDKLFVYTDGVTEATSAAEELFGTDRLIEALNTGTDAEPEQILHNVDEAIDRFVGEAVQFDDLTMLCLKYNG